MTAGGKDKKKLMFLGGLGVLLLIVVYVNLLSGPSTPAPDQPVRAARSVAGGPITMAGAEPKNAARPRNTRGASGDFHPVYIPKRPEERRDPTTIDPTMRWDLLTKVQNVDLAGGARNLFAFGAPAPVKAADLPPGPETHVALAAKGAKGATGPAGAGGPGGAPGDPPPLQINLKYYGVVASTQGGKKTACFLDGDDILLATEGDTLKRRYRVVRIGNTSVMMEDTESKREQSVPLAEEAKG